MWLPRGTQETHGSHAKPQMLAPAVPLGLSPSKAPSEFMGDDCFKFFNPVSTDSLNQYTAEWKLALMRDVNDRPEHAEQLAALLYPFGRGGVLVNLIPYNENGLGLPGGPLFRSARIDDVYAFQRKLWDGGTLCTVRVIASMNVLVPAVAVNVTVDVERNTSSPVVRSRATW